jgi:hypothetical protein
MQGGADAGKNERSPCCRAVLEKKLEVVVAEREKFSFQPYITGPPSTVNIILSEMCLKAGATARLPVQSI